MSTSPPAEPGHHHHQQESYFNTDNQQQPEDNTTTSTTPPSASSDTPADMATIVAVSGSALPPKRYRPAPAKTFQCRGHGDCRMVFSRSEHLARHIRKHTGERPFTCHCGKQFSRLDNLRQHAQTVHSDKPEQNERMMRDLTSLHASMAAANKATHSPGTRGRRSHPGHPSAQHQMHAQMQQLGHPGQMGYGMGMDPMGMDMGLVDAIEGGGASASASASAAVSGAPAGGTVVKQEEQLGFPIPPHSHPHAAYPASSSKAGYEGEMMWQIEPHTSQSHSPSPPHPHHLPHQHQQQQQQRHSFRPEGGTQHSFRDSASATSASSTPTSQSFLVPPPSQSQSNNSSQSFLGSTHNSPTSPSHPPASTATSASANPSASTSAGEPGAGPGSRREQLQQQLRPSLSRPTTSGGTALPPLSEVVSSTLANAFPPGGFPGGGGAGGFLGPGFSGNGGRPGTGGGGRPGTAPAGGLSGYAYPFGGRPSSSSTDLLLGPSTSAYTSTPLSIYEPSSPTPQQSLFGPGGSQPSAGGYGGYGYSDSPFSFHPPPAAASSTTTSSTSAASNASGNAAGGGSVNPNPRKRRYDASPGVGGEGEEDAASTARPRTGTGEYEYGSDSRPQSRRLSVMELCNDLRGGVGEDGSGGPRDGNSVLPGTTSRPGTSGAAAFAGLNLYDRDPQQQQPQQQRRSPSYLQQHPAHEFHYQQQRNSSHSPHSTHTSNASYPSYPSDARNPTSPQHQQQQQQYSSHQQRPQYEYESPYHASAPPTYAVPAGGYASSPTPSPSAASFHSPSPAPPAATNQSAAGRLRGGAAEAADGAAFARVAAAAAGGFHAGYGVGLRAGDNQLQHGFVDGVNANDFEVDQLRINNGCWGNYGESHPGAEGFGRGGGGAYAAGSGIPGSATPTAAAATASAEGVYTDLRTSLSPSVGSTLALSPALSSVSVASASPAEIIYANVRSPPSSHPADFAYPRRFSVDGTASSPDVDANGYGPVNGYFGGGGDAGAYGYALSGSAAANSEYSTSPSPPIPAFAAGWNGDANALHSLGAFSAAVSASPASASSGDESDAAGYGAYGGGAARYAAAAASRGRRLQHGHGRRAGGHGPQPYERHVRWGECEVRTWGDASANNNGFGIEVNGWM